MAQQRCGKSTSSLGSPTEDLRRIQRERRGRLPPPPRHRANLPLPAKIVSRLPPIEIQERRRIQRPEEGASGLGNRPVGERMTRFKTKSDHRAGGRRVLLFWTTCGCFDKSSTTP